MAQAQQSSSDYGSGLDWQYDGPRKQHAEDTAKATLDHTTSAQDAQLRFQQRETNSRRTTSQVQASLQRTRDTGLANTARSAAVQHAHQEYAADQLFAGGQQLAWRTQTTIDNSVALQRAIADVAFWTAQEAATVIAVQALDAVYNLPWTDFLVAQAQAHKTWWGDAAGPASAASKYIQWVTDRNNGKLAWQNDFNLAYRDDALAKRSSANTRAISMANATRGHAIAEANAAYDYVASVDGTIAPTKTYLDSAAQAERNYKVALAEAAYRRAQNENSSAFGGDASQQYSADVQQAEAGKEQALATAAQSYLSDAQEAVAARVSSRDTNERGLISGIALAVQTASKAITNASYVYADRDAKSYAALIASESLLDKLYALAQSASLESGLSSITSSPWASFLTAQLDAQDTFTGTNSDALQVAAGTVSYAQAGLNSDGSTSGNGEIGLAAELRDQGLAQQDAAYLDTLSSLGDPPTPPDVTALPQLVNPAASSGTGLGFGDYLVSWSSSIASSLSKAFGFTSSFVGSGLSSLSAAVRTLSAGAVQASSASVPSLPDHAKALPPPVSTVSGADRSGAFQLPLDQGARASTGQATASVPVPADQPLLELAAENETRSEAGSGTTQHAGILLEGRNGPPQLPAVSFEERQAAKVRILKALGFQEQAPPEEKAPPPVPGSITIQTRFGPWTWTETSGPRQPTEAETRAAA
jgi:hypothetical protein